MFQSSCHETIKMHWRAKNATGPMKHTQTVCDRCNDWCNDWCNDVTHLPHHNQNGKGDHPHVRWVGVHPPNMGPAATTSHNQTASRNQTFTYHTQKGQLHLLLLLLLMCKYRWVAVIVGLYKHFGWNLCGIRIQVKHSECRIRILKRNRYLF